MVKERSVQNAILEEEMLKQQYLNARTNFVTFMVAAIRNGWHLIFSVVPKNVKQFKEYGFYVVVTDKSCSKVEQREWSYDG